MTVCIKELREKICKLASDYPNHFDKGRIEKHLDVLSSLEKSLSKYGSLTSGQDNYLKSIERDYCALGDLSEWEKEYREKHSKIGKMVAEYYQYIGMYYDKVAEKILSDDNYVPPKRMFMKMIQNKYAQGLLEEVARPKRYPVDSYVMARKGRRIGWNRRKRYPDDHIFIVVSNNNFPRSNARGSTVYELLPFGDSCIITCEEREIKSPPSGVLKAC